MSYRLQVNRDELLAAMKPVFRGFKASELSQFILTYDGSHLNISTEMSRCKIKADGEWGGTVFVRHRGPFMKAIRHLPKVPTITIRAQDSLLSVAGQHMKCRCEATLKKRDREKLASTAGSTTGGDTVEPVTDEHQLTEDQAVGIPVGSVEAWLQELARNGETTRLAEIAELATALTTKSLKERH